MYPPKSAGPWEMEGSEQSVAKQESNKKVIRD